MHIYPKPEVYIPFFVCYEGTNHCDSGAASSCAAKLGVDTSAVDACVSDESLVAQLNEDNAKATAALGKSKLGTPWILVEGKHVDPDDLLAEICAAYKGDLPPGCDSVHLGAH